jgi:translation elongation factor EF-1alpha
MKRPTVLAMIFLLCTACISFPKNESGGSTATFRLKIDDAFMLDDLGVYSESEIGIVVYGNVESGKIYENSQLVFTDNTGQVLHRDTVFKIAIVETHLGTAQEKRQQSYAEIGDNVALYLKGWHRDDMELYAKYEKNLELIRGSHFTETE